MFNKVKIIGLTVVGLLAMLGTQAEASYTYVNGQWVYHSVGCQVTIGSLPNPPDPLAVGCVVTTAQVDALCPNLSIVSLPIQVSLSAQQLLDPGVTQVEVVVSDSPLLNYGNIVNACGGSAATAALIRNMVSTVTIQCIGPSASCPAPLLTTSTAAATCTLPTQFNLNNYPNNLPPNGTPFNCTITSIVNTN